MNLKEQAKNHSLYYVVVRILFRPSTSFLRVTPIVPMQLFPSSHGSHSQKVLQYHAFININLEGDCNLPKWA